MKKFALLALVLAFGGLVLAGCPGANNTAAAPANGGTTNTAPANNAK